MTSTTAACTGTGGSLKVQSIFDTYLAFMQPWLDVVSNHFDALYMLYFHGWIWFKMTRTEFVTSECWRRISSCKVQVLGISVWLEWYQDSSLQRIFVSHEIQHWKKKGRETGHIRTMWHRLLFWWYLVLHSFTDISLISMSILKYIPFVTKTCKNSPWIWWLFQKIRWPGSLGWIGCTSEICDFGKLHQQFLGKLGEKMMQASLHLLVIPYTGSNVGRHVDFLLDFISKINTWSHSERAIRL